MKNIENLKLDDLKKLLKQIKHYEALRKQLWNRWINSFKKELSWKNLFLVEYFSDKDSAFEIASSVYKKSFNINVEKQDIIFVKKEDIKGWIKVYFNDYMVDISFSKIEKLIK